MRTEKAEFDVAGLSLMIAMPAIGPVDPRCVTSHLATVIELMKRGIPFQFEILHGCSLLAKARSLLCEKFLRSRHDRLLMLDADQTFSPDDVLRLLALSTKLPVICAPYPSKTESMDFLIATDKKVLESGPLGMVKVNGLGLGFAMFAREVIARLETYAPRVYYDGDINTHPLFFQTGIDDQGRYIGEDIAFFADVRACGYEVLIDPTMVIGHVGAKEYKAKMPITLAAEAA